MSDVEIKNIGKLAAELKHLGTKGATKALRAGIGKGVTVLRKSIRDATPKHNKRIRKSIGSKVKINKKDGIVAKVGINLGKKKGKGYAPHAAIFVLGSGERHTKTGAARGRMRANPIVQKGLAAGESAAKREMLSKMGQVIQSEAGKK